MSNKVVVQKGRTNKIMVNIGMDVSADTITSEIRSEPDQEAPLIATWVVSKPNGGTDGLVQLELDNLVTDDITDTVGYMDLKRVTGGEPISVFNSPLQVSFQGTVTA